MTTQLLLVQALNGLQLGILLFLVAAGLTLVFGVMDFINLAHGVQYMLGAYLGAALAAATGSFWWGLVLALPAALAAGLVLEVLVFRHLYARDHLAQVLATFGVILFLNEGVKVVWGAAPMQVAIPPLLDGGIEIMPGLQYPIYRVAVLVAGLATGAALWWLVERTRIGMLVRAGATNREMVRALGVDVRLLYTVVFGLGALLAGLAGIMAGPLTSVQVGMGEQILILTFVVVVIGGIGSVRGAVFGAMLVGIVDTMLRAFLPGFLRTMMAGSEADALGAGLSSMGVYLLMALVLLMRPKGLFPAHG